MLGLPSPGLRSNGYSLARAVLLGDEAGRLHDEAWPGAARSLADELLRPSVVYSPAMAALRRAVAVRAFAHITGGGLPGNLVRVLPERVRRRHRAGLVAGAAASSTRSNGGARWPTTRWRACSTSASGMLAVVPSEAVGLAQGLLAARGGSHLVGRVVAGERTVTLA